MLIKKLHDLAPYTFILPIISKKWNTLHYGLFNKLKGTTIIICSTIIAILMFMFICNALLRINKISDILNVFSFYVPNTVTNNFPPVFMRLIPTRIPRRASSSALQLACRSSQLANYSQGCGTPLANHSIERAGLVWKWVVIGKKVGGRVKWPTWVLPRPL